MSSSKDVPAVTGEAAASVLEQVVVNGDLSKLPAAQRVAYYNKVCESLGLNPFTKPFDYIHLNGKLTLYAKRDATDQLRKIHGISVTKLERDYQDDIYVVTAYGQDRTGRTDSATGAVAIGGLRGEARANAIMKAETKAKRRLTLSLAGLGWLDETETDSIPPAAQVQVTDGEEIAPQSQGGGANAEQKPPAMPEVVHPGGKAPETAKEATAANEGGNASSASQRRRPTDDEVTLLRAAWRKTGLPEEQQQQVMAKPRADSGWANACREAAKHAMPGSMDELLAFARALGYTEADAWSVAESHDLFPFDDPERFTPDRLAATWADIRSGRRVEQATA